jgi:hypothetical protein
MPAFGRAGLFFGMKYARIRRACFFDIQGCVVTQMLIEEIDILVWKRDPAEAGEGMDDAIELLRH